MASLTMMASFIGGVGAASINRHRSLVVPKASRAEAVAKPVSNVDNNQEKINGRRAVMFAAVAAAISAAGQGMIAVAGEAEPKPGTLEAKKKYAPVCVTMPTASICHK